MYENYNPHGLPMRSCGKMREPHVAHDHKLAELGNVHCWGRNPLPSDAEEKYCTLGCDCEHCVDIRAGLHPRVVMCSQRWRQLPLEERLLISESVGD